MKRSTERFLTTHTGSLPRPDDLIQMMYAKENGETVDPATAQNQNSGILTMNVPPEAALWIAQAQQQSQRNQCPDALDETRQCGGDRPQGNTGGEHAVDAVPVAQPAEGRRGEPQVWGHRASWVDYFGEVEGEKLGIAIQKLGPVVSALQQAGFVVDCTIEGLMHAPETPEILRAGARILIAGQAPGARVHAQADRAAGGAPADAVFKEMP